jgi:L-ascorbate metabolism protein UlaG (beta-lactamase superfamily)
LDITWRGYSCFRIKGKEVTVMTDPYPPGLGYSLGRPQANVVTVSHPHPGHSYTNGVNGEYKVIKGPGEYELKDIYITGIATWHDADKGQKLGQNTIYILEMEGVTLCHLGDLGHQLSSELLEKVGDIDVLFLPVGGVSTIGGATAAEIVRRVTPKVAVPMHYKTPTLKRDLEPVDRFLKEMGIKEKVSQPKLSVSRTNLPASTEVIVLEYTK